MNKWIFALVQFFPLSSFAMFAFWSGPPSNARWLEAFQLGALLGIVQLTILLPQKMPLNRLVLAGNIYLIFGGVAVYFKFWWFLELYNTLRESAIILLMTIVGCLTTFMSSSGFIAVKNSARRFSIYLLLATASMIPVSVIFEGNRLYAVVLPIIVLAVLQRYLAHIAISRIVS